MKQKRYGKKILFSLILVGTLLLSLVSCGGGSNNAASADGEHGDLTWTYEQDGKTLTVSGDGALEDFEGADSVAWAEVRTSAEKLVLSEGITSIGDYAFYYMPAITEVELPSTVTELGDFAFAYCSKLETVDFPEELTSVGESAFEGCGALTSVFLRENVTTLGERAFAYCYSMTSFMMTGEVEEIGAHTFYNCRSMTNLVLNQNIGAEQIDETAFEGAEVSFEDAILTDNATGASTITVHYVYADGSEAAESKSETVPYGEDYSISSPEIEGYEADAVTVKGSADGAARTVTVTYAEIEVSEEEAETEEPSVEEEEDEPVTPWTIIAIVVMVLVLIGIAVGAFLLIRSDKKNAGKNTTTVRKNPPKGQGGKKK